MPGAVAGSLFLLKEGYPIIVVPRETLLASASANWATDWERAKTRLTKRIANDSNDAIPYIQGEVMEVPLEPGALDAADAWEGFSIGSKSTYQRIAVPVTRDNGSVVAAWLYGCFTPPNTAIPIEGSRWDRGESIS